MEVGRTNQLDSIGSNTTTSAWILPPSKVIIHNQPILGIQLLSHVPFHIVRAKTWAEHLHSDLRSAFSFVIFMLPQAVVTICFRLVDQKKSFGTTDAGGDWAEPVPHSWKTHLEHRAIPSDSI